MKQKPEYLNDKVEQIDVYTNQTAENESTSRKYLSGLKRILVGLTIGVAILESLGCEKKIPGEREPVRYINETDFISKRSIYEIETSNGKRFVEFYAGMKLLDYNEEKKTFKVYYTSQDKIVNIPLSRFKFYKTIEELEKDVKKEKPGFPWWSAPYR